MLNINSKRKKNRSFNFANRPILKGDDQLIF